MKVLFRSLAYRIRWARRFFLCHWRNRFPKVAVVPEREAVELHRRQKADFQEMAGVGAAAAAGRTEAARRAVEARLALLDGNGGTPRTYRACLEIGCENGWFGRLLTERGTARKVLGVDLREEEMRGFSRPPVSLLAASAERLPFKSGKAGGFDLVAAFHVVEHIRDPSAFRRELERLAAPSAHVILAVPLGFDEDPCHRWHYMGPAGWKSFLRRRYGLAFLGGGVHFAPDAEFLGLFRMQG